MKKFVFTLVVLLHLCYSFTVNMTLNTEILHRLEKLHTLKNDNKLNITSPDTMRFPTLNMMNKHASSCVSVFVRDLTGILDNVTVHEGNERILEELKANLLILDPHQQHDDKCKTGQVTQATDIFQRYAHFVRKLNLRKK